MDKARTIRGIILLFFAVIGCALLFFVIKQAVCAWFFAQVLPPEFSKSAEDCVTKVDAPISLEQARKELRFSLPDEATDILYAQYSQWMAYEFRVKYSAPVEVCKSQAIDIIQRYNENKNDWDHPIALEFVAISESSSRLQGSEDTYPPLNITWFDVHNITNGFVIDGGGSHRPMIWIDTDRNLFYYEMTD